MICFTSTHARFYRQIKARGGRQSAHSLLFTAVGYYRDILVTCQLDLLLMCVMDETLSFGQARGTLVMSLCGVDCLLVVA